MVIRKNILDKLYSKIKESQEPIELIGKAGVGKTILISQLLPHFFENDLELSFIKIKAKNDMLPFEIISKYCRKHFTYLPKALLKSEPKNRDENLRISLELISSISYINKKLVFLVIDDFHMLSTEEQENFKLLANSKISDINLKLLLIGRPGWENNYAIELKPFNKKEFNINKLDVYNDKNHESWKFDYKNNRYLMNLDNK